MDYITALAYAIYRAAEGDDGGPTDDDIALYRIYAVLCRAKGTKTTAEDVHDAWSAWRAERVPDHQSLIPFDELPERVKRFDDCYVDAIHRVSEEMRHESDSRKTKEPCD